METNETLKTKGTHIITLCDVRNEKAQECERRLEECHLARQLLIKTGEATRGLLKQLWDEYRFHIDRLHKFKTQEFVVNNITTTVGRSVLAQRLGGDNTYTGNVNYTALGSSNAAPTVADATLGTEVYRKALSSGTDASNIAYVETFFTATETTGTYEEYGMFIDGGAGADTGQLFNRFTQSITKSNVETLNVQSIITLNDA